MPRAIELLREKSRRGDVGIVSAHPEESVLNAARKMNAHRVGSLVVLDSQDQLIGVFTERDVLTRVVAEERDPRTTFIGEVMTSDVVVCEPGTRLSELRSIMRERRVRHVPIVEGRRVLGVVSIGDLNAAEALELSRTITYLEQYMTTA